MDTENSPLDSFDLQLIEILQDNSRTTAETLAKKVALSASAIARRVHRLRDEGWIADRAVVSDRLTKNRLFAIVEVQLDAHGPRHGLAELLASLEETPEVSLVCEMSGDFDVLIHLCATGMQEYNELVDRLLAGNDIVRRYESRFVKKWHKRTLKIPLRTT